MQGIITFKNTSKCSHKNTKFVSGKHRYALGDTGTTEDDVEGTRSILKRSGPHRVHKGSGVLFQTDWFLEDTVEVSEDQQHYEHPRIDGCQNISTNTSRHVTTLCTSSTCTWPTSWDLCFTTLKKKCTVCVGNVPPECLLMVTTTNDEQLLWVRPPIAPTQCVLDVVLMARRTASQSPPSHSPKPSSGLLLRIRRTEQLKNLFFVCRLTKCPKIASHGRVGRLPGCPKPRSY